MKVLIKNSQKDLKIKAVQVKKLVSEALAFEKIHADLLSIYFVSESLLCKLHLQFFNDPAPTDCISFPSGDDPQDEPYSLGEIFISPKAALVYANKKGFCRYEEVTLYIIHGLLHLLGYDDIDPADRKIMRNKEKKLMAHLKKHNLVLY